MTTQASIWQRKLDYEAFSRRAVRSEYLTELAKNHRSSRHLLRFLGHILLFTGLIWAMSAGARVSLVGAAVVYPLYLALQGLLIAGFMIHSHELSHNHIKTKWLNDLLGVCSGLVSFVNFYSFQHAHRLHHRNIGNLDAPEAGAPVSATGRTKIRHDDRLNQLMIEIFVRSKVLWFLSAWPLFLYYGDYSSWLLPYRARHRVNRQSALTFAAFVLVNSVLLAVVPAPYLLLYVLPVLIGGQRILAITFMHHAHEDSVFFSEKHHNFYNTVMATTDRDFGPVVNFFMMNNGYHIPHHLNPQIAYYDLKKASQHLRQLMPKHLHYHFYPRSRFYRDFFAGIYEQRLDQDHEWYQLAFLSKDVLNALLQQKRMQR